jgi:transposase
MNHERAKIARIEQILSGYQELQDINVHLMAQHIAEAITEEHELIIRRQAQIIEELETERELTKSVQTAQPSEQDRIVTLRAHIDAGLFEELHAARLTLADTATIERIHRRIDEMFDAALSTDSAPPQNTTEMQWLSGELEGRLAAALDDLRVADTSDRAVATLKFLLLRAKEIASGAPPQNTAQPSKPKPSMPCAICGERRDLHALPMQCPESMKEWSVVTVFTPAAVPREQNAPETCNGDVWKFDGACHCYTCHRTWRDGEPHYPHVAEQNAPEKCTCKDASKRWSPDCALHGREW